MANMNGRAQQQALLSWLSLTPSSPSPSPSSVSSSSSASPVTSFAFAFECNFNYTTLRFLPGCVSCGSVCVILMFYACRTLQPVTCSILLSFTPLPLSLFMSLSVDPLPFVLWLDCLANAMQISTLISGHSIDIQFSTHCS